MPQLSNVLVTAEDLNPYSPIAESYRSLRTAIRHKKVRQSEHGMVLMVASPKAQEGKSTTCSNLAVTYAQDGQSVIMVDCNLRQPSLHALFGTKNQAGLMQYLQSTASAKEVIATTFMANLSLLSSGGQPLNPSELLGSSKMASLLGELKQQYDVVLLDSPPTLEYTDAELLSEYSDGVLLVTKHGKTKREWARQARIRLEQSGARILGIVMNQY